MMRLPDYQPAWHPDRKRVAVAVARALMLWSLNVLFQPWATGAEQTPEVAKLEASDMMQRRDAVYRGLAQVRSLMRNHDLTSASDLLRQLSEQAPDPLVQLEVYRTQMQVGIGQSNRVYALGAVKNIFDLLLAPTAPPDEVAKASSMVLHVFNVEYPGVLAHFKLPPPSVELRRTLMNSAKAFGRVPGTPGFAGASQEAVDQQELARALICEGHREEGLAAYRQLFEKYPEFLKENGLIINTWFAYVEAHGHDRRSPERLALLETLYRNPVFQTQPRIANIGVHLGHAYRLQRSPLELDHWRQLTEQIEHFRKLPDLKRDVSVLLKENHEAALMNYAEGLYRRGQVDKLPAVLEKLEANFSAGAGGETAQVLRTRLSKPAQ